MGVPFFVQWGSLDDNVPPWNSRRLVPLILCMYKMLANDLLIFLFFKVRMLDELSGSREAVQAQEVFGAGHWWNGLL